MTFDAHRRHVEEEGALFDLRTRQREHAGIDLRPFTPPAMKVRTESADLPVKERNETGPRIVIPLTTQPI